MWVVPNANIKSSELRHYEYDLFPNNPKNIDIND